MPHVALTQYKITTMIARTHYENIAPLQKLLLLTLSSFCDGNGGSIKPSLKTLATLTGMARSTVQKHLDVLVKLGYVVKLQSGGVDSNGQNYASQYQLDLVRSGVVLPDNVVSITQPDKSHVPMPDTRFLPPDVAKRLGCNNKQ